MPRAPVWPHACLHQVVACRRSVWPLVEAGEWVQVESWAYALDSSGLEVVINAGVFHIRHCKICADGIIVRLGAVSFVLCISGTLQWSATALLHIALHSACCLRCTCRAHVERNRGPRNLHATGRMLPAARPCAHALCGARHIASHNAKDCG